jgi:hypothetical protein
MSYRDVYIAERMVALRLEAGSPPADAHPPATAQPPRREVSHGLSSAACAWLGGRLVVWGTHLQAHYQAEAPKAAHRLPG